MGSYRLGLALAGMSTATGRDSLPGLSCSMMPPVSRIKSPYVSRGAHPDLWTHRSFHPIQRSGGRCQCRGYGLGHLYFFRKRLCRHMPLLAFNFTCLRITRQNRVQFFLGGVSAYINMSKFLGDLRKRRCKR